MLKMGNRDAKSPEKKASERNDAGKPQDSLSSNGVGPSGNSTVIGENIFIEGLIKAEEDIIIEGSVSGSIIAKSHKMVVGKKGNVEADVQAETVVVNGRMKGTIIAFTRVFISEGADFTGFIKTKSIAVEDGSMLKATIELDKDLKEQSDAPPPPHAVDAIILQAENTSDKTVLQPA